MHPIPSSPRLILCLATLVLATAAGMLAADSETDWTSWRGPFQNGTSSEKDLPSKWVLGGENDLWTYDLSGRGTPVIFGEKVYVLGYRGEGPELQEVLA